MTLALKTVFAHRQSRTPTRPAQSTRRLVALSPSIDRSIDRSALITTTSDNAHRRRRCCVEWRVVVARRNSSLHRCCRRHRRHRHRRPHRRRRRSLRRCHHRASTVVVVDGDGTKSLFKRTLNAHSSPSIGRRIPQSSTTLRQQRRRRGATVDSTPLARARLSQAATDRPNKRTADGTRRHAASGHLRIQTDCARDATTRDKRRAYKQQRRKCDHQVAASHAKPKNDKSTALKNVAAAYERRVMNTTRL